MQRWFPIELGSPAAVSAGNGLTAVDRAREARCATKTNIHHNKVMKITKLLLTLATSGLFVNSEVQAAEVQNTSDSDARSLPQATETQAAGSSLKVPAR